ncbi:MAG: type I restriction endonuclease, partial [Candidatus Thorarchaeota archaeon]
MVDGRRDDEFKRAEKPFLEQLKQMGWKHAIGDIDVPYIVKPQIIEGRKSFKQVLLFDSLRDAIQRINLDDNGEPWLDDTRLNKAISDLERPGTHQLMKANREITRLLIKGIEVEGLDGKKKTIKYIDFKNPERNHFLAINQFRVDPPWSTGDKGFIIPDIVLFINGIPLIVVECKKPDHDAPLEDGIDQLLRYSNQREWVREEFGYEGVEKLFHYVQIM